MLVFINIIYDLWVRKKTCDVSAFCNFILIENCKVSIHKWRLSDLLIILERLNEHIKYFPKIDKRQNIAMKLIWLKKKYLHINA